MNLFQALSIAKGINLQLDQKVVYILLDERSYVLSEVFFTHIGQGMITLGGSFSHTAPGINNSLASTLSAED